MGKIILFYKYVAIEDTHAIMRWQKELCASLGLTGRVLLGTEGINATLGGSVESTAAYIKAMNAHPLFGGIDFKDGDGDERYFPKLKVLIKKEIVNFGIDPARYKAVDGGEHLTPAQAHDLLKNPPKNLVILDGRNNYESRIGAFEGAIKPDVQNFRDFPEYIAQNKEIFADKEVLMYCTGGIRCERASALVKQETQAAKVYQIEGGIHRYAEQFPDGFFRGKNYVFDARIATPVTSDILTTCDWCPAPCDEYTNCINAACNKQIIICADCEKKQGPLCCETCKTLVIEKKAPVRIKPTKLTPTQPSCMLE